MTEEEEEAGKRQQVVRLAEFDVQNYNEEQVKQAVIHSRQDIVLIYSMLVSAVKILKSIRFILGSMLLLLVISLFLNL